MAGAPAHRRGKRAASVPMNPSQPDQPPGPAPAAAPTAPPLGRTVGRGAAWMVAGTVGTRVLSFFAQIALGWFLAKGDWGIYGIAASVAFFLQVFRDGGVRQLLVQRGPAEYESLAGPVFWMAAAFNTATALLLCAAAPVVAAAYGDHRLVGLFLVMAAAVPLGTPGVVSSARLRIDLRFGTLTRLAVYSAAIRYAGSVGLAWMGAGPLAFVLPLPVMAAFESLYCGWQTGERPWRRPAEVRRWPALFGESKWLIVLAVAMIALDAGDYPVIGLFFLPEQVGEYYFAYQLVAQTGALLAANVESVLLPALTRLGAEPARRREAIARSLCALALLATPASLLLGALFAPLELLLWKGKWAGAAPAVHAMALFYPGRALFVVASSYLLAVGRFRAAALLTLALGGGRMLAALLAGALTRDIGTVAWIVGGCLGAGSMIALAVTLRHAGLPSRALLVATLPAWLLATAAAAAALGVDALLATAPPLARLAADGAVGALVFGLLARALLPHHLADALAALPLRARPLFLGLLRLRDGAPNRDGSRVGTPASPQGRG